MKGVCLIHYAHAVLVISRSSYVYHHDTTSIDVHPPILSPSTLDPNYIATLHLHTIPLGLIFHFFFLFFFFSISIDAQSRTHTASASANCLKKQKLLRKRRRRKRGKKIVRGTGWLCCVNKLSFIPNDNNNNFDAQSSTVSIGETWAKTASQGHEKVEKLTVWLIPHINTDSSGSFAWKNTQTSQYDCSK